MTNPISPNAPSTPAAWLQQAETAPSLEAALRCLNQAAALAPGDPTVQQKTYQLLQALLQEDPDLEYDSETDQIYRVHSGGRMAVIVPKDRSVPEPYPAPRPTLVRWAQTWLWLSLAGLLTGGLGTMMFAPPAALFAIALNFQTIPRSTRILSLVLLMAAGGLWLLGLLLGVILLMHLL